MIPAMAQVPSDLMNNCNQWKITYPNGVEDKTLCGEPNNEYFYVNDAKDAIVFFTPIRSDNGTTPNSSYIRSELREREVTGNSDIFWTTEGNHMLYVKQAITHLPIKKPHLVATQIHGNKDDGIDDSMVMRLENSHLFLSFNGGKLRSNVTIKTNYVLGTKHEVIFLIKDGKHYCYYAEDGNLLNAYNTNTAAAYLIKAEGNDYVMDLNYDQTYFKVGNYTQSNSETEGIETNNPNNYGEVLVYDFSVVHDAVAVSGVSFSPSSLNILLGATQQLSAVVSPSNATNKGVSYTSSNTAVATVSQSGLLTSVSIGNAIITATTDDGSFTATCAITVLQNAEGPNLALNKSATGTGTPDGSNVITNLVDGNTSSRWSVSGYPQTALIDLGQVYNLGRTELVCYSDRAYKFTISASETENGTYTQLVNRADNTVSGTASNPIVDIFGGVNGRFVKITVTGANNYTGSWISLSEFRIFAATTLGIDSYFYPTDEMVVWPNPVTNILYFKGTKNYNKLSVFDQLGKQLMNTIIDAETVDVSALNSGIYFFKFSNSSNSIVKRVLKK
tara:strand:- start:1901 stop:3580 length:1680 start_codon:yes stop_codon:yes gene_type:complete